jgi:hypothetical protein
MLPSVATAACYHAKHKNCLLPSVARRSTANRKVSNIIPETSRIFGLNLKVISDEMVK